MIWFTIVSDFLLYAVVSLLAGHIVLQFVPDHRKPAVTIKKSVILLAIASIPVLSAAPAIQLAGLLMKNSPPGSAIWMAITEFQAGQSFIFSLLLAFFWFGAMAFNSSKEIQAFWFLLAVVNIGFGSHAASLEFLPGMLSHTVHFLALSLWAGVLLVVTFFAADLGNWRSFLKWFTPFAFGMVMVLLLSGIAVWLLFSNPADYAASWVLPYGQMLLLKHLSILPLLAAAVLNGFGNKAKAPSRPLLKLEVFLLGLVFLATATMSKLAPPHNVVNTLLTEGTAPFLELVSGKLLLPIVPQLSMSVDGILLVLLGFMSLGLMIMGFFKKLPLWILCLSGLVFVAASYIGLMMNMNF